MKKDLMKTIPMIAGALFTSIRLANWLLDRKVKKEIHAMFSNVNQQTSIITEADLIGLPFPVQKWLRHAGVIGKERIHSVRLKQKGYIRTKQQADWMRFKAEQYYTTREPAFIWYAKVKASPFVWLRGRDKYRNGHGNMLIQLLSLIKIADVSGYEINQGTLIRFLNEVMWFPAAALQDYISWQEVDDCSAKAVMSYGGVSASALFYFNTKGELVNFTAKRFGDFGGTFKWETWSTPIEAHQTINGYSLPTKGSAKWELESGDFQYVKIELQQVEYNVPEVYENGFLD